MSKTRSSGLGLFGGSELFEHDVLIAGSANPVTMPQSAADKARHATAKVRGGRLRLPVAVLRGLHLDKDDGEVVFWVRDGVALVAPLEAPVLTEPDWD